MVATRSLADDLALAHRIVDATAPISLDHFTRGVDATAKADGSPVTQADHDVERAILDALAAERPDDSVLSEESGAHGASSRRWVIDPIDGTAHFAAGRRTWSTMFALEDDGELVLGMIDLPALGVRYWATRGGGAYARIRERPDRPMTVHTHAGDLSQARATSNAAAAARGSAFVASLQQGCTWMEPTVGLAFDVLGGSLDVVLVEDYGEAWDHAPLIVILEEAGGAWFDLSGGRRYDTRHGVYTLAPLAQPVRALLGIGD